MNNHVERLLRLLETIADSVDTISDDELGVRGATLNKDRIVKVVASTDGGKNPHAGRYVMAWNPHTKYGVLELTSTDDARKARRFSLLEAMGEWYTVSNVMRYRPDGKPNRPLRGVTVEFLLADEATAHARKR